jgi:TetR/AcrR family acrAB operon transcriptional repressor
MALGVSGVASPVQEEHQRRRRDKEETRARVVDAARTLFSREGFERVTIRMIAEEAGVATGSVFITFTSKDELCDEIMAEYAQALGARLQAEAVRSRGMPTAQRLAGLAAVGLDAPPERLTFIREAVAAAWTRNENAERKLRHAASGIWDAVHGVLQEAVAAGELPQGFDVRCGAELVAMVAMAAFRHALYEALPHEVVVERVGKQLDMLIKGWAGCPPG